MALDKSTLITVAAAAVATLTVAATTIEGASVLLTRSLNPLNLRVRSHFKSFERLDRSKSSKGFDAVSGFVGANGAGTLTATNENDEWVFVYTPKASKTATTTTTEVQKGEPNKEVLKDWAAVRKFLEINDVATAEPEAAANPENPEEPAANPENPEEPAANPKNPEEPATNTEEPAANTGEPTANTEEPTANA